MVFKIGQVEIGVSANIADALRNIQRVQRELGSFSRLQSRFTQSQTARGRLDVARNERANLLALREQLLLRKDGIKAASEQLAIAKLQVKAAQDLVKAQVNARRIQAEGSIRSLALSVANKREQVINPALPQLSKDILREEILQEERRLAVLRAEEAIEKARDNQRLRTAQLNVENVARQEQALGVQAKSLELQLAQNAALQRSNNEKIKGLAIDAKNEQHALRQLELTKAIQSTLLGIGTAFVTGTLTSAIADAAALAARVNNLGTVLRNVGQIAGYNEAQLFSLENRVKSLGITTQAARQSLVLLGQGEQDLGQAAALARIAQDSAAIAAVNSSEAFERLVVAIQRLDTRLLRQLGIVINLRQVYSKYTQETGKSADTLTATEKQQLLLNEVLKRGALIAGTYEASLNDAFKQMTSLDRLTEELRLSFGRLFQGGFELAIAAITKFVGADDNSGLRRWVNTYPSLIAGATAFTVVLTGATAAVALHTTALAAMTAAGITATGTTNLLTFAVTALGRTIAANPIAALLVAGFAAASAAIAAYSAHTRALAREQEIANLKLREQVQIATEVRAAVHQIQDLGSINEKTAEQQDLLNKSVAKIIDLLPQYSAQLKAVQNDLPAFLRTVQHINANLVRSDADVLRSLQSSRLAVTTALQNLLLQEASPLGGLQRGGGVGLSEGLGSGGGFKLSRDTLTANEQIIAQRNALLEIAAALKRVNENGGEAGRALSFAFDEDGNVQERFNALIEQLRQLEIQITQFQEAVDTIELQRLDNLFEKQQDAAQETLNLTKEFEKERLRAIQDTNIEIVEDFKKLSDAQKAHFLSLEEVETRFKLRSERDKARIEENFADPIADARKAVDEADAGEKLQRAQKALSDLENKRASALLDAQQLAREEADLARKQLEERRKLEEQAAESLADRLALQLQSVELLEKEARFNQLRSEDGNDYLQTERGILEVQRARAIYLEQVAKRREELVADPEALRSLENAASIQLRQFAAQENALREALTRSRADAKRETALFIQDTQDALNVTFNSEGAVRRIAEPFRNLTQITAQFRQEFRQQTDSFIENIRRSQDAAQTQQIGRLYAETIKQQTDSAFAQLRRLRTERDELFTPRNARFRDIESELDNVQRDLTGRGFSSEEAASRVEELRGEKQQELRDRRDELDQQIRDQELFLLEQQKIQKAEQERFQQAQDQRTQDLALQGQIIDAATTVLDIEKQRLEIAQQRLAIEQALIVTRGGNVVGANGQPVTVTESQFAPTNPQAPNAPLVTVNPLAGINTADLQANFTDSQLVPVTQENGAAIMSTLEQVRGVYTALAEQIKDNTTSIQEFQDKARRDEEAFRAAVSRIGAR